MRRGLALAGGVVLVIAWGRSLAAEPAVAERVKKVVAAAGGPNKLLKLFQIKERLAVSSDPAAKGAERVSVLEPPGHWWLGKTDRVKEQKEPAIFLVWVWTLGALVEPRSKLEAIPDARIEDRPAYGIRVSETIKPPLDAYFDAQTHRLLAIDWRGDRHIFSDWKEADGAGFPAKVVGYKKASGQRWYHTEILELQRLQELPAGLSRQ